MLLISMAFGQTGGEPPSQINNVRQWCLNNAIMKDQLVRRGGCIWAEQPFPFSIPGVDGKRYDCKPYPNGKKTIFPAGYEGKLLCPDPFGNLDKDGNLLMIDYNCAACVTSNNTTGTPDEECMTSMYNMEIGFCQTDAAKMIYFHDINEIKQNPLGGPVPTPDMQF